jgi:AraC-like DNA-binding protein
LPASFFGRSICARPGAYAVVGIRLTPHGAGALFLEPQDRLVGQITGLDGLSSSLSKELGALCSSARETGDAARMVQSVLARHVDIRRIDHRVHAAVDHIRHAHGLVTMDSLAAHLELTSRHLERHFKNAVGISPKRLARITRFQRALRMFEQLDSRSEARTPRPNADTPIRRTSFVTSRNSPDVPLARIC